jgi:hypothetical protein
MYRLDLERKKGARGRKPGNIQVVAPVQGIQEVENPKNSRSQVEAAPLSGLYSGNLEAQSIGP